MRPALVSFVLSLALPTVFLACGKEEPPPQSPQPPYGQQPGYGTPPQGTYPTQPGATPGYPTQPGTTPPATTPTVAPPVGTTPPPAATMSQPGAGALPCSADANCLTHRCNTQAGKCAFPCQTDADCAAGNRCVTPACLPAMMGGQQ